MKRGGSERYSSVRSDRCFQHVDARRQRGESGASCGEANIATTEAAMESDAAQVESFASAENELSTPTVARTNEETEYSR